MERGRELQLRVTQCWSVAVWKVAWSHTWRVLFVEALVVRDWKTWPWSRPGSSFLPGVIITGKTPQTPELSTIISWEYWESWREYLEMSDHCWPLVRWRNCKNSQTLTSLLGLLVGGFWFLQRKDFSLKLQSQCFEEIYCTIVGMKLSFSPVMLLILSPIPCSTALFLLIITASLLN